MHRTRAPQRTVILMVETPESFLPATDEGGPISRPPASQRVDIGERFLDGERRRFAQNQRRGTLRSE